MKYTPRRGRTLHELLRTLQRPDFPGATIAPSERVSREVIMPGMPEHVSKGAVFKALDHFYADAASRAASLTRLREGLAALQEMQSPETSEERKRKLRETWREHPLTSIGAKGRDKAVLKAARPLGPDEVHHVQPQHGGSAVAVAPQLFNDIEHVVNDWLRPKEQGGWWSSDVGPVEEILMQGLITALEISEAHDNDLPIDTVWICAGADTGADAIRVECHLHHNRQQVTLIVLTPIRPHDRAAHRHAPAEAGQHDHSPADGGQHDHPPTDARPDDPVLRKRVQAIKEAADGMLVVKANRKRQVVVLPVSE